jgi:hypothetical protein
MAKVEDNDDEYNVYKLFTTPAYTWELCINNLSFKMIDPLPNRFQRWMLKKCFNMTVILYPERARN